MAATARQDISGIWKLRQHHLVSDGMLQALADPPTYTRGSASGATTVPNAIAVPPANKGAFCYRGPLSLLRRDSNSFYSVNTTGLDSSVTYWAIEWISDSPLFDIVFGGNTTPKYRLAVDQYDGEGMRLVSLTPYSDPGTTNQYRDLFDWDGVRRLRHYRLECEGGFRFGGLDIGPQDTIISPAEEDDTIFVGDSMTEPTIVDSDTTYKFNGDGCAGIFGRALGLHNCYPMSKGGTGYVNSNSTSTVRDRFDEVVAQSPARVFFCAGLNDANREPTITAQMVYDECVTLFTQARTQLPNAEIGVFSPIPTASPNASLFAVANAIGAAATACNLPFYDLMGTVPEARRVTALLTADTTASSSISVDTAIEIGSWIRVGTPDDWGSSPNTTNIVRITGSSGSGPYTLNLNTGVTAGISSGSEVTAIGESWVGTGTGRQGATNDDPRDLLIGSDNTHPTIYGHKVLSRALLAAYRTTLGF